MLDFFQPLKDKIRLDEIDIDNTVFKLHYKVTAILLMAFALMSASKQYIGDPIDCDTAAVPAKIIDQFCWIHSTNIIQDTLTSMHEVSPGLGNHKTSDGKTKTLIDQKYYQWMALFLSLQFIMFNATRKIWKTWEGGKLEVLAGDLRSPVIDEDTKDKNIEDLAGYFKSYKNLHDRYFHLFFLCELINFFHVIGQIYFLDLFFGGKFLKYGTKYVDYSNKVNTTGIVDPKIELFPTITRCSFRNYGPTQNFDTNEVLCILPVNIVNEKIAVCLWFWFIILAVISGVAVLFSMCCALFSSWRSYLLKRVSGNYGTEVDRFVNNCNIGDWFLVYQMSAVLDVFHYQEFIKSLVGGARRPS